MDWAQILVIILSSFLAIFLILAIILVVLLIRVTREIREVTSTAARTALKFEGAANNISAVASPIMMAKLVRSLFESMSSNKKSKK